MGVAVTRAARGKTESAAPICTSAAAPTCTAEGTCTRPTSSNSNDGTINTVASSGGGANSNTVESSHTTVSNTRAGRAAPADYVGTGAAQDRQKGRRAQPV